MGKPCPPIKTELIIQALKETHGMVSLAAERVGCAPKTIYARIKSVAAVREVLDTERSKMVDIAEMKLYSAIMTGESWAIALVLKTIGKDRGYVERQELTGADGGPVKTEGRVIVLPDNHRENEN